MNEDIKKAVLKMSDLARLELSEENLEKYAEHAEKVIKYFEKLGELDTSKVEPTSHAVENTSLLRDDKVVRFEDAGKIMEQVPEMDGPFLQVPKVI